MWSRAESKAKGHLASYCKKGNAVKLDVVSVVILVVVFVAWLVSAEGYEHEEEKDDMKRLALVNHLVSSTGIRSGSNRASGQECIRSVTTTCPNFEKTVDTKVREWTKSDPSLGPTLLRSLFHDFGVTYI
ncbi:unnamed protein product [Eruca vesicaria subsp. sativa]|uniref:Plant heme peroxidase family profile domain-containing protein n=1 Tax=Eruca vesicaria subsp. sativa TaxID=29727 RepID=A0ABC8LG80_ERUVS|nr:unnamed protein product [Eruca vesicaria subsp. sativa]